MGEKIASSAKMTKHATNLEKRGKKRKKSSSSAAGKSEDDFNLDEVLKLGGTKADFDLLQNLDDDDSKKGCKKSTNDVGEDEIRTLIKSMGLKTAATSGSKKLLPEKGLPVDFNWGEMTPDQIAQKPLKGTKNAKDAEVSKETTPKISDENVDTQTIAPKKKKSKNKYRPESVESKPTKKSSDEKLLNNNVSSNVNVSRKQKKIKKGKTDGLIIKPGDSWFNLLQDIESKDDATQLAPTSNYSSVKSLESEAAELYEKDVEKYRENRNKCKKSETEWYEKVVSSGTLSDKQAALQLFIAESPVHNLFSLDSLIAMSKKKGRKECIMAAEAIKDVLVKNLLPKNRQLNAFNAHKMHEIDQNNRERQLLLWYFEGELKKRFSVYVESLVAMLQDNVDAPKEKALGIISSLLAHTLEEQTVLLNVLINKVGDPNYKIASKTVYILTKLIKICPLKKSAIIDEVEKLVCRPNMQQKALYYAFCFLSNIRLKEGESKLAERLIKIYFSFFQRFIKQGELDNRMLSILLAGVNSAFPIILENREFIQDQMDTLHRIIHLVNFNTSLQVLMLLYQILETGDNLSDRFYSVFYRKMCDPALKSSNRQVHFLNLLFRAIKKDHSVARVKAFIKRLLQICCYQSPPFVCGALCLLSEVYREKPDLVNLKNISENFDDGEEHFKDVDLDSDDENEKKMRKKIENQEVYDSDSDSEKAIKSEKCSDESQETPASSWIHHENLQTVPLEMSYAPHHRNPLYCQAETTPLWELQKLSLHYHPTVALYASTLLSGKFIDFDGDPLEDYTLMRFLDRFVFKNPKKVENVKDTSAPKKHQYKPTGIKLIPVNSSAYLEDESSIPVEEKYLYKYFAHKDAENQKKGIFSDDEEVDDEEFDKFIENYEGCSKDYELDGFDFYHELSKQTGKKKNIKDDFSSDEESEADGAEESDEDVDFGNDFMSEFKELDDDDDDDDYGDKNDNDDDDDQDMETDDFGKKGIFNEEDIRFSDSDSDADAIDFQEEEDGDDDDDERVSQKKKLKRSIENSKDNPKDVSKLFMAAEEFSSILEEGHSEKALSSHALVNRDKASAKQLKWEMERERWMKGINWKSKKRTQHNWKKKKSSGSSGKKNFASGGVSKRLKKKGQKNIKKDKRKMKKK